MSDRFGNELALQIFFNNDYIARSDQATKETRDMLSGKKVAFG
jgi:hypothetical protein